MASVPSLAVSGGATAASASFPAADARRPPPSSVAVVDKSNWNGRSIQAAQNGSDEEAPLRPMDVDEAMAMLRDGKTVRSAMYVPLLHRCVEAGSLGDTRAVHGHMVKTGTSADVFVATSLVNAYMQCGASQDARSLFDGMPEKNVVTWTALITGYTLNSQPAAGMEVFVEMLESGRFMGIRLSMVLSRSRA
ncbi:unnamed protein product [Urochloa humidicola]